MKNILPKLDQVIGNYYVRTENELYAKHILHRSFSFDLEIQRVTDFAVYKWKPRIKDLRNKVIVDVILKENICFKKKKLKLTHNGKPMLNDFFYNRMKILGRRMHPKVTKEIVRTIHQVCKKYLNIYDCEHPQIDSGVRSEHIRGI